MNEILPEENGYGALYLGSIMSAQNLDELKSKKVRAVLTVASFTDIKYTKDYVDDHKIIEAEDFESFDLGQYFDEGVQFIEKNLSQNKSVLVHCFAGVSRSSSLVIAYIMKTKNWTFDETLAFVKAKRFQVYPNSGFQKQLKDYEKNLKNKLKN